MYIYIKKLKKLFLYPLFLFITLLFVGCVPSNQPNQKDHPTKIIEYKGALKYFKDRYGQEMYNPINPNEGFYITLPECFKMEKYSSISLTGQFTYLCNENSTYITIDPITKKDVSYYRDYFEKREVKALDDLNVLIDYVMEIRALGLNNATKSVNSTIITHKGKKMLLGTVIGRTSADTNELSYQYGVLSVGNNYYVLQAIVSLNNIKYLRENILEIFKSFRG